MAEAAEEGLRRFVTFRTAGQRYAVSADHVAEVIRMPRLSRVPQSPRALLGLANVRGVVLPVASVSSLMGRDAGAPARDALVFEGATPFALAVESVEGLSQVPAGEIDIAQGELAALPGEQIQGVFRGRADSAMTKILDITALIGSAFASPSRAAAARHALPEESRETAAPETETRKIITFAVAGQNFALDLQNVREVIAAPKSVAALPASDEVVLGVMEFRDRLAPLFSLRALLGLPRDGGENRNVVVTAVHGALAGLLVDSIRAVISGAEDQFEALPPVLRARMGGEAKVSEIFRAEGGRQLAAILALENLFRGEVMQRLRAMHEAASEAGETDMDGEEIQFVIFGLGDDEFGLPIESVVEVGQVPAEIARLPKAPKFLEGAINLRGEVLPVLDQRKRFDMPPCSNPATRRLLVVRSGAHRAGLIVDSVTQVLRVRANAVDRSSAAGWDSTHLVHGIVKHEQSERLIVVLDPGELLSRSERALLDAFETETRRPGDENSGG